MTEKTQNSGVIAQNMIEVDFQDMAGTTEQERPRAINKTVRKKIFPVGIFFMLFFIESVIAAGASAAYFLYAGRNGIAAIESYTRSYSMPLADAFGAMTEMCYRSKNYSRLRALFREKIEQKIIGEAFVVLRDGRLIAHSDPEMEKTLKGNLASDEFAYNLDLILRPVYRKSRAVLFADYNIPSMRVPYERDVRAALKTYFYPGIDTTGWLVSRAVFGKKKPVGAVCFIISKQRVFSFLSEHADRSLRIFALSLAVAFAVSLIVSLVVFFRYRSIQRNAISPSEMFEVAEETSAPGDEPVVVQLLSAEEIRGTGAGSMPSRREIKDAIPVGEKE